MYKGQNLSVAMRGNGIAQLRFDATADSVNKFNQQTIEELAAALDVIKRATEIKGLLVTSAKPVFIVGADIMELGALKPEGLAATSKQNNANFTVLEDLPFPTLAIINGYALGGGFELCMACDFRVMSTTAQVGLPETKLGLIPGWGGTVRLPRLIGLDNAVEWIAGGEHKSAEQALKDHAVDAVVAADVLEQEGLAMLQRAMAGELPYQARRRQKTSRLQLNAVELQMAVTTAKAVVLGKAGKHYPAPLAAIDVMARAASLDRDGALVEESKTFAAVGSTPQARALVGLFMSDQYLGKIAKQHAKVAESDIKRAAVLGAGIMGGGIAYQHGIKGVPILMKDIAQASLDQGMSEANKLTAKQVERGRLSVANAGEVLARITPTLNYAGVEQSDLVIEAVVENPKVKLSVLSEVEALLPKQAVLASNTSTISIDHLASVLKRPENFCGMHFFNPVHAMPLVEVIRGEKSSDETIGKVVAHALALGKKPVVVKDCPGFLVNRVLFPAFMGFNALLAEGADFQQIDRVLEKWGWPMGPAYLLDVVGIDTAVHAVDVMAQGYPDRMKDPSGNSPIRKLYEAKRLGQKSGAGFYRYETDQRGKPKKLVDEEVYSLLGIDPVKVFTDDEIIARYMAPMSTELARCLEEGIVASPAEADMALIYGVGLPPFRGGVFRWLDEIGLAAFIAMTEPLGKLGTLYQPTDTMREMARENRRYYSQVGA